MSAGVPVPRIFSALALSLYNAEDRKSRPEKTGRYEPTRHDGRHVAVLAHQQARFGAEMRQIADKYDTD